MAFEKAGIAKRAVRADSTLKWFSYNDGNILGGALVGAGMSLTGACPGTVFVQVGHGVSSSVPTILGALSGGLVFARYGKPTIARKCPREYNNQSGPHTIASKFGINATTSFLVFEFLVVSAVALSSMLLPGRSSADLPTVVGGMLIGVAQAVSVTLTGSTLGVSAAYEHVGAYVNSLLDRKTAQSRSILSSRATSFALGIMSSSFLLAMTIGSSVAQEKLSPSLSRAFVGGFMLSYGARVAGGCTSGHGLSGLSMFSYSSLVTVTSMFGTGMIVARLIG